MFRKFKRYTALEVDLIKESSLLVGKTLAEVAKLVAPGASLKNIDTVAEQFIRDHNGVPSFKGYHGFPAALCISVNDVVVHGIPNNTLLNEGDIVSIDCGVLKNNYHADYAYTFTVGNVDADTLQLIERTKESLFLGIEQATVGNYTGDIGHAIQTHVEKFGYGVVRDLCGHGCGRKLHEFPEVPNFGKPKKGSLLQEGMVICIEPMINRGTYKVKMEKDGWTIRTLDGKASAHFEHQVLVTSGKPEILSTYQFIEEVLTNK